MNKVTSTAVTVIIGMAFLTGCQHLAEHSVTDKMATVKASQTQTVVNIKDVLDSTTESIPTLTAVGYAVTSTQPGQNEAQKRLMAIPVSYTHLRAHETLMNLVCRLLLEKKRD